MEPTPLRRSLSIQSRVIHALLMREIITRYGRHNIGFLWLFIEPMLFTMFVAGMWSLTRAGFRLPIIAFAITGYSTVMLWRNMPGRCIGGIGPNASLMYHRNVRPLDIYASRLILEAVGGTVSFVALTAIAVAADWMAPPENILKVAIAWALLAWFGASLGLLLGTLSEQSEAIGKIWQPVSYILLPLSGAVFMVEWLPPAAQAAVLYIPTVHGTELLREGYFGSQVRAIYDVWYLIGCNATLTLLGLAQERRVTRSGILAA